jgi:prepilin-type N-terminal cleavage/methylation domain-containing protein
MKLFSIKSINGFTLLELVIVILVMSILARVIFIKWPGTTINLGAQTEQLANDIRYTQALAMTHGQRYYLSKASNTTYQIKNNAGTAILFPQGNTTTTLNSSITFGTLTNLPNNLIAFDGKGIPYTDSASPGTALAVSATIPLTAGGQTTTIVISPETGRILIQ